MCTRTELATFDASQILGVAKQKNMTIIISDCHGGDRQCVYVAWGGTAITGRASQANCMVSGVYVAGAKCLVMVGIWVMNIQRGFTLIELMIALILGSLIVAASIQVFINANQSLAFQQEQCEYSK